MNGPRAGVKLGYTIKSDVGYHKMEAWLDMAEGEEDKAKELMKKTYKHVKDGIREIVEREGLSSYLEGLDDSSD
jgi:hypothetical protein